jgi:hypothetical protein
LAICAFSLFNELKEGTITSAQPFFYWLILAKVSRREEMVMVAAREFDESEADESYGLERDPARGYAMSP